MTVETMQLTSTPLTGMGHHNVGQQNSKASCYRNGQVTFKVLTFQVFICK